MPESTYAIHDRPLRVCWQADMPRRAIETILEYHGLERSDARAPRWTMQTGEDCIVPPGAVFVASHDKALGLWRDAGHYFIRHSDGVLRISPEESRISGLLPRSSSGVSSELYIALTLALLLLLEADGFFAVHAACLVSPEGAGVLVVGPSDSGKSTMSLHLVSQGWRYLSDDSVLLFDDGDRVGILPLRRDFCFDPEAEELFPELRGTSDSMLTDADKWRVQIDRLYPQQRQRMCHADLLLFPQIVPDAPTSSSVPMRGVEALTSLLPQASLLRREQIHARVFTQLLSRLVSQAPAYRFLSGADVYRDSAHLSSLLQPLLPSAHAQTDA